MEHGTEDRAAPVALVTGGSRGIGRAIVAALTADGWRVAFTYRQDAEAARQVEAEQAGSSAFALDLADPEAPRVLVAAIEDRLGAVVGLVNNAGVQASQLLGMTGDALWSDVLDVNLGGSFRCTRAVLPGMVRRRRGAIVNVSSLSALRGVAGQAAYGASKAGLLALTRSLAREMGRRNIRVNAVVPGYVATDMTAALPEPAVAALRQAECLPIGTSARAVADAVAFLLSDRASAITGQCLCVDAGASC
ncbi:MAG TPA: SDR family oxidoreductase [Thermoanaerobaculia bacterium]|nr:SDR family oxidoreductase [Thermoanaerobaculia bacterium]